MPTKMGTMSDDRLIGGSSADTILGLAGNDYIDGGKGNDWIEGGEGDDTLTGNYGTDRLYGGDGNDTFLAEWDEGRGDTYDGGDGIDTYNVNGTIVEAYALYIDLIAGTSQYRDTFISIENLTGGKNADRFWGDDIANVLSGMNGNDLLDGRGGNDALDGGEGSDRLTGGDGNDRLTGGVGADSIEGGAGIDTADYRYSAAGVSVTIGGNASGGDAEGDKLSGIEHLSGSNHDDVLAGDAANNRLVGRQGSDQLSGGDGNDMLVGGGGYDDLDGGAGTDTVDFADSWGTVVVNLETGTGSGAEAANDRFANIENVTGSDFDDRLTGHDGANRLVGNGGDDRLDGAAGNDVLVGGEGADKLLGGEGERDAADYQQAAAGVSLDLATGGTGGEAAGDSFSGIEFVYGSAFADAISGDDAVNRLVGGDGGDSLAGGNGNDYLLGGRGGDTLAGDGGADVFCFDGAFGNDVIEDFWSGAGRSDRLWLTGTGLDSFAEVIAAASETGAGVVIEAAGFGTITLMGASLAGLHADDFLFG